MCPDFRSPMYLHFLSCPNACAFPRPPPFYFAQWWWTSTFVHWTYLFMSFNPGKLLAVLTKVFRWLWVLNFFVRLLRASQSCLDFFVWVFGTKVGFVLGYISKSLTTEMTNPKFFIWVFRTVVAFVFVKFSKRLATVTTSLKFFVWVFGTKVGFVLGYISKSLTTEMTNPDYFIWVFRAIMLLVMNLWWFEVKKFVTKTAIFGRIFWSCNFLLWLFWQLSLAAWSFGTHTFLIWIMVTIGFVFEFITGLLQIWIFCVKIWFITVRIVADDRGRIVPKFDLILSCVQQSLEIIWNLMSQVRHLTNWKLLASK